MTQTASPPLPALPFIRLDDGAPYIEGRRCTACEARTANVHLACPACGGRDTVVTYRAPATGTLHAYSIVRRSFPGVEVPFISAVVDLDDGLVLKGNLIGVEPDPDAIRLGMPIRLAFGDALGRKDKQDNAYVAYFFEPA